LSADGVAGLLVTGRGHFRARLTQVRLDGWRLTAVEEALSRIAFIVVPAGVVLVSFSVRGGPSPIWAGIEVRTGEMLTFGPGQRLHARTIGPSHWGTIQLPERQLAENGLALNGAPLVVPPLARWQPRPAAARQLRSLHRSAIRMAEARAGALTDNRAADGLEQQLIYAMFECLSAAPLVEETTAARRGRDMLARFEDLLQAEPLSGVTQICAFLGVSNRKLRACCNEHLGMGPSRYLRLYRMLQLHQALRAGNPDTATASEIAGRYGFRDLGRLATKYRAVYAELPSATLRRTSRPGAAELT
jgi:AraC-like DNA-binding protein